MFKVGDYVIARATFRMNRSSDPEIFALSGHKYKIIDVDPDGFTILDERKRKHMFSWGYWPTCFVPGSPSISRNLPDWW